MEGGMEGGSEGGREGGRDGRTYLEALVHGRNLPLSIRQAHSGGGME